MAFTSKDFAREVDKLIKQGLTEGVPPQFMFAKLALSGQEMGNYQISLMRDSLEEKQAKENESSGIVNINGHKIKSN